MLFFPPCKINIGLHILRKRPDRFHDLELSFFQVPQICDILEITPSATDSFLCEGIPIGENPDGNLVVKARNLLREKYSVPPCRIHLYKRIPAGSGLGGGSSDATFTLIGLNHVFQLGIRREEIEETSKELGSDCAFFTHCNPCIGKGKGDILHRLDTGHRKDFGLLVLVPELAISTVKAYANCQPESDRPALEKLLQEDWRKWKESIANDFEKSLFSDYPILAGLKEQLYQNGAFYASLSGSGSAVYGLFENELPDIARILPENCLMFRTRILIP